MCNFRAASDDDLTAFPDSAKIKYEAILDERYFYTNSLIYTYVEKRQSFCTMYALGGAVDIFALSLSLHPRCIVTSIDNVFWFIQTMEFVRPTDRLKLKGCIVAHRRIKIFTISIFGPPHVKFPLGKHSSEYRFNHLSNFNHLSCPYFSNVCTSIHGDLYRGGGGWLIFHNLLPYYFYIPSKLATYFLRSWLCNDAVHHGRAVSNRFVERYNVYIYISRSVSVKFLFLHERDSVLRRIKKDLSIFL